MDFRPLSAPPAPPMRGVALSPSKSICSQQGLSNGAKSGGLDPSPLLPSMGTGQFSPFNAPPRASNGLGGGISHQTHLLARGAPLTAIFRQEGFNAPQ
jgi:hypothetical protein